MEELDELKANLAALQTQVEILTDKTKWLERKFHQQGRKPAVTKKTVNEIGISVLQSFFELEFGLSEGEFAGPERFSWIAEARHMYCFMLREAGYSLEKIGKSLGGRHHTTIMNSVEKAEEMLQSDPDAVRHYNRIVEKAKKIAILKQESESQAS